MRSDTVLGLWMINLLSGKRHFIAALKGLDSCQCGCRGNCSRYPLFANITWQLEHIQRGTRPIRMHDGTDSDDITKAGQALGYSGVLIYIKGDWAEHAHSLSLQSWASVWQPCQFCELTKDSLNHVADKMGFHFRKRVTRWGGTG